MAYADALRTAQASFTTAATLIDGLLVSASKASASSLINTTSTSWGQMTDMSVTVTVPANSIVKVTGVVNCSNSSSTLRVFAGISQDSTSSPTRDYAHRPPTGATHGFATIMTPEEYFTPSAGSHTYRILWIVDSGATMYVTTRLLNVYIFQKGP